MKLKKLTQTELNKIIKLHKAWLKGNCSGKKADLSKANLFEADLAEADLSYANLTDANLYGINLNGANLFSANLSFANLAEANLAEANLAEANLAEANLAEANLAEANLSYANLSFANLAEANLAEANLSYANLSFANLCNANLQDANLLETQGLVKIMGVAPGGIYWKRFNAELENNDYKFKIGLNKLPPGEVFAADDRCTCTFPGFHFASRSWCAAFYPARPLEARIQIPLNAKINEPWATDGKASADSIIILEVYDTTTGKDITEKFRPKKKREKLIVVDKGGNYKLTTELETNFAMWA